MRFRLLVPMLALAALLLSVGPAAAKDHRTAHDPCAKHGNGKSINDEGSNGVLHCGAVWDLDAGHHSEELFGGGVHHAPQWARPDDCASDTVIKGTENRSHGVHDIDYSPHWFFAPLNGEWVTWVPESYAAIAKSVRYSSDRGHTVAGAVNLTPKFFNHSSSHDWPLRYFFYCVPAR